MVLESELKEVRIVRKQRKRCAEHPLL